MTTGNMGQIDGEKKPTSEAEVKCLVCKANDGDVPLMSLRYQGRGQWVCVHCLPRLIHG